jgi:tRNA threonylcarbamoyladenosine biosynthesis protein TsaB
MLLALDTASETASLALFDRVTAQLLAEQTWRASRRHTQELLTSAQTLFRQVDSGPEQLTALAVTTGPGSFTGVRVAISIVKGIGMGLLVPPQVVGVPTLCVTAAPWRSVARAVTPSPLLCAYLRAGRGRYNWAFFSAEDELRRPEAAEHWGGNAEEMAQTLAVRAEPIWLVGELDATLAQTVSPLTHVTVVDAVSSWRRAGQLAQLAAHLLAAGIQDDLHRLQPLYLRNP